jgi:hypothetical protein
LQPPPPAHDRENETRAKNFLVPRRAGSEIGAPNRFANFQPQKNSGTDPLPCEVRAGLLLTANARRSATFKSRARRPRSRVQNVIRVWM